MRAKKKESRQYPHLIARINLSAIIALGMWQRTKSKTRPIPTRLLLFQTTYVLRTRTTVGVDKNE